MSDQETQRTERIFECLRDAMRALREARTLAETVGEGHPDTAWIDHITCAQKGVIEHTAHIINDVLKRRQQT